MTWRKLRTLVEGMPPESATWTAIRNATPEDDLAALSQESTPETGPWSQLEMLVAQLIDAVNRNTHSFTMAHSEKGSRIPPPEPVRRPGWRPPATQKAQPTARALARLDAMLGASA